MALITHRYQLSLTTGDAGLGFYAGGEIST